MAKQRSSERFIIHNTTVKPPRLDAAGKDRRNIQEKKGYIIQFRDENDSIRTVSPPSWGANPVIVSDVSQGLLELHAQGVVRVEKIEDITATLGLYRNDPSKAYAKGAPPVAEAAVEPDKAVAQEDHTEHPAARPAAKVSEMGKQDYSKEETVGAHGYPGAVNPDGRDNFTVVATGKPKKKKFLDKDE